MRGDGIICREVEDTLDRSARGTALAAGKSGQDMVIAQRVALRDNEREWSEINEALDRAAAMTARKTATNNRLS